MVPVWLYSLNTNKEGNYVRKAMRDCTGEEVCREWLYHIGVPEDRIETLAHEKCNTTNCLRRISTSVLPAAQGIRSPGRSLTAR